MTTFLNQYVVEYKAGNQKNASPYLQVTSDIKASVDLLTGTFFKLSLDFSKAEPISNLNDKEFGFLIYKVGTEISNINNNIATYETMYLQNRTINYIHSGESMIVRINPNITLTPKDDLYIDFLNLDKGYMTNVPTGNKKIDRSYFTSSILEHNGQKFATINYNV